ncbi:isochorismatase family protein [Erwinia billingiae]|uniref:isochorismatase family protein n=1 Tax=Erwinia billingiae TaxID=182337 RepID=UPI0022470B38|nr:isochorismatase family protein [Erwinia billingiae]MCX0498289.1 isochorismatase family protein [Erwinia billingiae]
MLLYNHTKPPLAVAVCRVNRAKTFIFSISLLCGAFTSTQVDADSRVVSGVSSININNNQMINARDVQIIFVDLQPELIKDSQTVKPEALTANAAVLAKVAKLTEVPVTFSIVPVQGIAGRNIPELIQYTNANNTVPRILAGTFTEPRLVSVLASHKRNELVIAGYATEVAVLQTALNALKAGYTVYVAVDATGSRSGRTESAAMRQMELAGAIPTSVLAVAAQIAPDFSKKPGSDVLATFDSLSPP